MISTQNNVDETISRQNKNEIFQNNNKIKLFDIEKNKMTIYLKSNREDLVFSTSVLNKNSLKPVLKSENRYQMLRNASNIESTKFSNNNTTRKDASPIPSRLPVIWSQLTTKEIYLKTKESVSKGEANEEIANDSSTAFPKVL